MAIRAKLSSETLFRLFLIVWGILNLFQAILTPLNPDEAYYWMYSNYPAWGYFDHPPMIAMMIRAGYSVSGNQLGLRLFVVMAQLVSFILLWQLLDDIKKNKANVFFLILLICSLPVVNIFGFFATPDSPLLLFEILFLFLYRKFSGKYEWKYAILLGVSMAAIMYSKYHGAILIIMVILSDLRLLKNPRSYIALLFAIILFVPHIIWQNSNDFPSVNYHIIDRASGITFKEFPQYLLNTLIIQNPLILPAGLVILFTKRNSDRFERTLSFIIPGVILFFLITSFRYHVEPHWTALIALPLVIIIFNNIDFGRTIYRYLMPVVIASVFLIILMRIVFMFNILPVKYIRHNYHESKRWFIEIEKIAGERPVVFTNSYQNASKYTFYTGKFSHSLNNLNYRKNQYDIWDFEEKLHGKEILYVPHFLDGGYKEKLDKYPTSYGDTIFARKFFKFQSLQRECCILKEESYSFSKGDTCRIDIVIFNPYPYQIDLKHEEFPVRFQACFFRDGILMFNEFLKFSKALRFIDPGESVNISASFTIDDVPAGDYKIAVCSETGIEYITYNSKFKDATIIE